jgi:3-oxoacyl-[acyl-carrier protein] reductase
MSNPEVSQSKPARVALVTGGSRGIGKACVVALAQAGYKVAFSYISNQAAANAVVAELTAQGHTVKAYQSDAATQGAELVQQVHADMGQLDALVNNAGITRDGLVIRMSDADWDAVIATNLTGVFQTTRAAVKVMMKQRYGRIVNMSSVSGVYGNAGQLNYAASKAGVIGLSKSLAKEVASRNITVNVVAPGFIETDMTANLPTDKVVESIALGRLGTGEDIAKAVTFLITSGDYVTGQVLCVDGGIKL